MAIQFCKTHSMNIPIEGNSTNLYTMYSFKHGKRAMFNQRLP